MHLRGSVPPACNRQTRGAAPFPARETAATRRRAEPKAFEEEQEKTPAQRPAAMTWSQRLKRVFGIDIETCPACGGALRIIARIEDPAVIDKILTHIGKNASAEPARSPPCRAPPQLGLF